MRLTKRLVLFTLALAVIALVATTLIPRSLPRTPPEMAPLSERADQIVVFKQDRRLELWRDDVLLSEYEISLGGNPEGHKLQEGDERTPEGTYVIDWRNQNSVAHLSLHISYPNDQDMRIADARGISPGGNIMIHSIINGWGWLGDLHRLVDWTNGCIAVKNEEMREIWSRVPNGTPITIAP